VAALLGLVVLVAAVGSAGVLWQFRRAERRRVDAEAAQRRAEALAARLALDRGRSLAERGDVARALPWMARALALAPPGDAALRHAIRANLAAWSGRLNPVRGLFESFWIPYSSGSGKHPRLLPFPSRGRLKPTFSPDGKTLLVIDRGDSVRLWSTSDGTPAGKAPTPRGIVRVFAFSPDAGTVLIAGTGSSSSDRSAQLWSSPDGTPIGQPMKHDAWVTAAAFSPDGRIVATGCASGAVRLWRASDATPLGPPWQVIADPPDRHGYHETIGFLSFSRDGEVLLVAGAERRGSDPKQQGLTTLLRVRDGTRIGSPLATTDPVVTAVFSPGGRLVLTGMCGGLGADEWAAALLSLADGSLIGAQRTHSVFTNGQIWSMALSPGGSAVLHTGWKDKEVAQLWDPAASQLIGPILAHQAAVAFAAFSPDGRRILTAAEDGTARLWDAADGTPVGPVLPHRWPVRAMAMSPDGKTVLTASLDGSVRLWPAAELRIGADPAWIGAPLEYAETPSDARPSPRGLEPVWAEFAPDSRTFWVARQGSLRLWKVPNDDSLRWPLLREDRSNPGVFLPDGQEVYVPTSDAPGKMITEAIRAPTTLWERHERLRGYVGDFSAPHPGGKLMLAVSAQTARLIPRLIGGKQPSDRPGPWSASHRGRIRAAIFSLDGQTLVTGGDDRVARLWSVSTGKPIGKPMRHQGPVTLLAVSPDGRTVLTASEDRTVRLWSIDDGTPIGPPLVHPGPVRAAGFSPDGRQVLTGTEDKVTRTWKAPAPIPGDPLYRPGVVWTSCPA
jgi:WD40 repeat protein